jgi:hypothetical protein
MSLLTSRGSLVPTEAMTLEQLQQTMLSVIQHVATLCPLHRRHATNALLNVAAMRLVDEIGQRETAALLWRLADAVSSTGVPDQDHAIDLRRADA